MPRLNPDPLVERLADHKRALDRYVYESTRGAVSVEDVVQETLLRATEALRSDPEAATPEGMSAWLGSIAAEVLRETLRTDNASAAPLLPPSLPDPTTDPDGYVEMLRLYYGDHVRRYVLGMCRNGYLADDVTSETFERALRSSRRDGAVHDVPIAWLKTIARNLLTDSYRRAVNRHEFSFSAPPESGVAEGADARLLRMESLRNLSDALDLLTPGQRQAVEMRTLNGYSTTEVAAEMGRSEQAVRSLIHKATRVLIDHYRNIEDQEPRP